MAEIGSAFLSILPSAKGFGSKLESEVSGESKGAGKKAGAGFGTAFKVGAAAIIGSGVVAGAFLKGAVADAREAQKVTAATNAIIKATGGAAKISAAGVMELSGALAAKTGFDDGQIQAGQNLLLTFKNVKREGEGLNDIFKRATVAGLDLAAAGFGSVEGNAVLLGKALNDPIKGLSALAKNGVTFTEGQKEQIKGFVAANDLLSAQKVILGEVEAQVGGTAEATATAGEKAAFAFGELKESIGTALLPVIDRLQNAFVALAPKIQSAIDGIGPLFQRAAAFVKPFADAIQIQLVARFQAVKAALDFLQPTFDKIGGFLRDNPAVVKTFAGVLVGLVGAIGAVTLATTLFSVALNSTGIPLIIIGIAALAAGLVYAYQTSEGFRVQVDALALIVQTKVVPAIQQFAGFVKAEVIPAFITIGTIIRDQVLPTLVSLGEFFLTKILPIIVNTAVSVGSKLKPAFEQLVETFKSKVLPTIQLILAKFEEYRPAIQKVIEVVAKIIGEHIQFAAAVAGKVLPVLIQLAGFILSKVVPAILAFIDSLAAVIGDMVSFGKALVQGAKDAAEFAKGVKEKFEDAVAFIRTIPLRVTTALGNLKDDLLQAGRDLVQGFVNGIKERAASALGAVTDALASIKNAATKIFEFGSPSKLFKRFGAWTMEGFENGVNARRGKTVATMASATRDILEAAIGGLDEKAAKLKAKIAGLRSDIAEGVGGKKARKELKDKLGDLLKDLADTQVEILDRMRAAADKVLDKIREKRDAIKSVLGDLKSDFKSLRDGIASAFTGNLFEATNVSDFVTNLAKTRANLGNLKAAFKKLLGFGLSPAFLAQLFQSGNLPLILDLAKEPRDQALNAESLFNQTNSLANSLGTAVAREEVGPKIDRTNQRLESIERVLRNQAAEFAEAINNASTRGARGRAS